MGTSVTSIFVMSGFNLPHESVCQASKFLRVVSILLFVHFHDLFCKEREEIMDDIGTRPESGAKQG
jgi:hypothetical protein